MPSFVKHYKDNKKLLKTRNMQRKRNYAKTAIYKPSEWTIEHDDMVLKHNIPDSELSAIIKHSVQAIQMRRWKLKKDIKEEAE